VIMADDLDTRSLDDLLRAGLMPNLQSEIIDQAISFEHAFTTTPLCCPSRASFLTGNYAHNTSILNNQLPIPGFDGLYPAVGAFDDSDTIGTRFQALGYTTALIGKYLNGYGSDAALANVHPAYDPHYVQPAALPPGRPECAARGVVEPAPRLRRGDLQAIRERHPAPLGGDARRSRTESEPRFVASAPHLHQIATELGTYSRQRRRRKSGTGGRPQSAGAIRGVRVTVGKGGRTRSVQHAVATGN